MNLRGQEMPEMLLTSFFFLYELETMPFEFPNRLKSLPDGSPFDILSTA
jgi:hypothetical protein